MQYGSIDDARRTYITPQSVTQYPWVIGSTHYPNPIAGPDNVRDTPIDNDQSAEENTL